MQKLTKTIRILSKEYDINMQRIKEARMNEQIYEWQQYLKAEQYLDKLNSIYRDIQIRKEGVDSLLPEDNYAR